MTFDFADGLLKDNLLIVDRETNSIWSQLDGKAVSGPLKGFPLQSVPSLQTTWKFWRQLHPDTRVMVEKGKKGKPYVYRNRKPGTKPQRKETRHDTSSLGLGIAMEGQAVFFPLRELKRAPLPVKMKLGERWVSVHYREDALTAWAEDSEGNLLPGVLAYEGGWKAFNPHTSVYHAPER